MNVIVAFMAGLLTFFTPCVFPLIPSYMSYITGFSLEELAKGDRKLVLNKSIIGTLCFIIGFSIIFILLGFSASFAGSIMYEFQNYLRTIGGLIIVLFGLMMTGLFNIKFLEMERRFSLKNRPVGYFGSLLLGMTFAAGWVPCVGPILSSMLIIASTSGTRFYGGFLLFSYCVGLGIPIFISAVAFDWFLSAFDKTVRYLRIISIISGMILVIIGIMLISDSLALLTNLIYYFPSFRGVL
jgi:cytochrome c-type biogenesis protein